MYNDPISDTWPEDSSPANVYHQDNGVTLPKAPSEIKPVPTKKPEIPYQFPGDISPEIPEEFPMQ